ncbi:MAG TPA: EF-hand domain-containing protein [Planctomycetota bacterium]|nr:EF-hand domain-containing protein [Planctomycetota bacterium]
MIPWLLTAALLHGDSVSSSRLEVNGREVRVAFTFSLEDVATLARLDLDRDGKVSREEWAKVLPLLLSYVGEHFQIDSGGEQCLAVGDATRIPPAMSLQDGRSPVPLEVCYQASREISRLKIRCTLFQEHGGNLRHVAELSGGAVFIFDRGRTDSEGTGVQRRPRALWWSRGGILAAGIGALGLAWRRRAGAQKSAPSGPFAEPSPS